MRGKALLLIGAVAGAIFASTPQGREVIRDVKKSVRGMWERPDVQRTVSGIQTQVRTKVPVVGDYIADAVDGVKPGTTSN